MLQGIAEPRAYSAWRHARSRMEPAWVVRLWRPPAVSPRSARRAAGLLTSLATTKPKKRGKKKRTKRNKRIATTDVSAAPFLARPRSALTGVDKPISRKISRLLLRCRVAIQQSHHPPSRVRTPSRPRAAPRASRRAIFSPTPDSRRRFAPCIHRSTIRVWAR